MKYAIVYSSRTGNTGLLAEALRAALPEEDCLYFGGPSAEALKAPRIYAGFWTDKGTCDEEAAAFLKTVSDQEVFLFGTAGFGGEQAYFDKVLARAGENLSPEAPVIGSFMCQGKMPMSVRQRYEAMEKSGASVPNLAGLIENFDRALSHPDEKDLENLKNAVRA